MTTTSNTGEDWTCEDWVLALSDKLFPEHRVHALMAVMPCCRLSAVELRKFVVGALAGYRLAMSAMCSYPSPSTIRRHLKRIAATARKLDNLLRNPLALDLVNIENWERASPLKDRLKPDLHELAQLANDAAVYPFHDEDDPMGRLLRGLVGIYELATGAPAKLPWTDRITGELRGPLLDFLQIAGAKAFESSPMTRNAIRHRLRTFLRTGGQSKENVAVRPVQSASRLINSPVIRRKQRVGREAECPD